MDSEQLCAADLTEMSSWISRRVVSSEDLVAAALAQCEKLDPLLNAFITVDSEGARSAAKAADGDTRRGIHRGPLHGIPVAVKDVFSVKGLRLTAGSKIMANFVPGEDAAAVVRLRRAGAVIIGKTNLPEFAYSPCDEYHAEFGPIRNPWDLARFPGASSSGSAAAVAARIVPLALGSDSGGSIRTPASFCGITGFKPTYGLVSLRGVVPLSPSLDHVGLLARSANDCNSMLAAVAGFDPEDESSSVQADAFSEEASLDATLRGVRFGALGDFFSDDVQPDVADAINAAINSFVEHGAVVSPMSAAGLADDVELAMNVLTVEASYVHDRDMAEHAEDLIPEVRTKLMAGRNIPGVAYLQAGEARRRVRARLDAAMKDIDMLVSPTNDTTAPRMTPEGRVLEPARYLVTGRPSAREPFNLTGQPAISIPCGFDRLGLPIGMQLVGRRWADRSVLSVAHAYQSYTDWHLRLPPVAAAFEHPGTR